MDSDIRYGKEMGVDDYLVKPVEPEDLLAVVRGKIRRARNLAKSNGARKLPQDSESGVLTIGHLQIDTRKHHVRLGEKQIKLSAREFKLLERLARQPANVVSPEELIQDTHGLKTDYTDASALLRPLIRSLRRKLGYLAGDMGCIECVRGVGYQLIPQRE